VDEGEEREDRAGMIGSEKTIPWKIEKVKRTKNKIPVHQCTNTHNDAHNLN